MSISTTTGTNAVEWSLLNDPLYEAYMDLAEEETDVSKIGYNKLRKQEESRGVMFQPALYLQRYTSVLHILRSFDIPAYSTTNHAKLPLRKVRLFLQLFLVG